MNIAFTHNGIVHDIQISTTTNKKLTEFNVVMQTYHFSIEQVANLNLSQDAKTCFDCKFSYNQNDGKSGGCYTHKGVFRLGLVSKLRRLNKLYTNGKIKPYSKAIEKKILKIASNINFLRLGAYGEAVTLPQSLIEQMCQNVNSYTAYTVTKNI